MKRLDKFLEVLFLRGAKCLVLQTGSAAHLQERDGTVQAVMQRTLSSAHIISAIGEITSNAKRTMVRKSALLHGLRMNRYTSASLIDRTASSGSISPVSMIRRTWGGAPPTFL